MEKQKSFQEILKSQVEDFNLNEMFKSNLEEDDYLIPQDKC